MFVICLIVFFIFIFNSTAFAKIGEVYFCTTDLIMNLNEGKYTSFKNETFKFKRNKNNITFGNGGYFDKTIIPNVVNDYNPVEAFHYIGDKLASVLFYNKGRFIYSQSNFDSTYDINATFSIFE